METSVSMNAYRIAFSILGVFVTVKWQEAVGGPGWLFGMGAFLVLLVDFIVIVLAWKGNAIRELTVRWNREICTSESGVKIS